MNNRRSFLKGITLGSGATVLSPMLQNLAAAKRSDFPQRFVFVVKSSGIIPAKLDPPSLIRSDTFTNESLADHKLPDTLAPLDPYKDQLAIVQGLSGKMCKGGHSSWYGAMGVYKTGGEHNSGSILRATADAEIARLFPAPFQHVGLALRGKVMGNETQGTLYPGITAVGQGRELPFQASPDVAYQQLFGSAITNSDTSKKRHSLKANLLDFMVGDIKKINSTLPGTEREKMQHYLHAFEELQVRREKLAAMGDQIRISAPPFDEKKFTAEAPELRQAAHLDLTAAALISGITNVVTMRLDNISVNYAGLGLSDKNVHGIGHGETCNGKTPEQARDIIRLHHMKLLADLAGKLKAVPEGDGTMLDNTSIIYLSDAGNEHHGNLSEWPYIVLGGSGGKMNIAGRYIRYPEYGKEGHKTIGNWWTTWLNAFGTPVEHYGNLDLNLQKNGIAQSGALSELMA
ncbi:MAG: hypothetical protein ACI8XO_000976 [Verrucomicrobiales bacterium]|jgi:hypothetical protein